MTSLFLLTALLAQVQPQAPQQPKPSRLPPWVVQHGRDSQTYYRDPKPERGMEWMDAMLKAENLQHPMFRKTGASGEHRLNLVANQLGHIAAGHAKVVRHYEMQFAAATDDGKTFILKALAVCGDEETQAAIKQWLDASPTDGVQTALEATRTRLALNGKPGAKPGANAIVKPSDIDLAWSEFYITGKLPPVARVLDVFDEQPGNAQNKRMAEWSLRSNLRQHKPLQDMLGKAVVGRPAPSQKIVQAMLDDLKATFPLGVLSSAPASTWGLKFEKPNRYTVLLGGEAKVRGVFALKGNRIEFTDTEGPLATKGKDQTGLYQWRMEGATLILRAINDPAPGRKSTLQRYRWEIKP